MQARNSITRAMLITACALTLSAQDQKILTARELFYAEAAAPAAAKRSQAKAANPQVKPPAPKKSAVAKATPPPAAEPVRGNRPSSASSASGAKVVLASYTGGKPLGLRYSFLRKSDGDEYREVDPATVFQSGDRIRVSLEANDAAYLYVVMKGSSGSWKVMFPSPEIAGGRNRVESGNPCTIPPAPGRFAFDEQVGDEQLFLVLSRKPEASIEELIYSLASGDPATQEKAPAPMLMAQNLPDSLVGRLRNAVYARDLVFEKVDETTAGDRKEKAVYVVNRTGDSDSRLVVDLTLKHR
jgi:hypothetical protein